MSSKAEDLNRFFEMMGDEIRSGGSFTDICKAVILRKNKENAGPFGRTPFNRRLLLLPHCLRSSNGCAATEHAAEWVCGCCGLCKIDALTQKGEELGYMGVKVLKGGSAIGRLVKELKPTAVLGVACSFEGALGMLECERLGVAIQSVALCRDGCSDTDVTAEDVFEVMEYQCL
jgi:hypothetical protein